VPDLIPIEEAAAEFGAAQTSLYRYLKAGRLKRYKKALDRRTFVDRQELRRLVRPRIVE
jgi:predicted site-specific integrase-resolvase